MEATQAAVQFLDQLPDVLGKLWLAEMGVSVLMAGLVSLPLSRLWGAAKGSGAAAVLIGPIWLTVGVVETIQTARAARSHPIELAVDAPSMSPAMPASPSPRAARPHRRMRPAPPVNCIRVLTDPAQSTC